MNFFSLGEEEGASDGKARHRKKAKEDVPEGRGRSLHWRSEAKALVQWKARLGQDRSPLNHPIAIIKIKLFIISCNLINENTILRF